MKWSTALCLADLFNFFFNSFCGFCPREIYVWLTIHKRHGRTHSFKVIETSNIKMIPWQLLALFHIHGYWYFSERNQLRDPQRYLNAGYIFFTCNVSTFISRWITKESNLLLDYVHMKRRMFINNGSFVKSSTQSNRRKTHRKKNILHVYTYLLDGINIII